MKLKLQHLKKLRHQAERKLTNATNSASELSAKNVQKIIHELHTHQIELELQNQELRDTELELVRARDHLNDLYEFAPVAYVIINDKGLIEQCNLTFSRMAGMDRVHLHHHPFASLIAPEERDNWHRFFKGALSQHHPRKCDSRLISDPPLYVQLDCRPSNQQLRITLTDISRRKQAELAKALLLEEIRKVTRELMRVQEEERRQLSRELHDELGQLLTSIDLGAEHIANHAAEKEIRDIAGNIVRDTKTLFEISRQALLRLRPVSLDTLGLTAALRELTENWQTVSGLHCQLQLEGELDQLDESYVITIYRLVQEGLTNAVRHGRASSVDISLGIVDADLNSPSRLHLSIKDNGRGMQDEYHNPGMGVIGMRERVHALHGDFRLSPLPDKQGMQIEALIPLLEQHEVGNG